jgi:AcrR family transcriptional regulator
MANGSLSLVSDAAPSEDLDATALGKREQTKVQNREAILLAARAVFGEIGYETATVRDIIRRTGLASGTFYNYYRSKEEVATALAVDVTQKLRPILRARREQAVDFKSYLDGAIRAYFQFIIGEQRLWHSNLPRAERYPHIRIQTPGQSAVFEEVRASIVSVMERGLAPRVDPEYLTAATIGVAQRIGEIMLQRVPVDLEGAVAFAVNLILNGLPTTPPAEGG